MAVPYYNEVSSLGQIRKSPYEGNESAEVGEHLFEYTKSLIDPEEGLGSTFWRTGEGPSGSAIEVFGEEQAGIIQKTNRYIAASGILYGCGWTEGTVQGWSCGRLENDLLLISLLDYRIARSSIPALNRVIKDLDARKIFSDALFRWKLNGRYPRLALCDNINSFKKKQIQCFKCILFIARAATCMKYLDCDFLAISEDTSLISKLYASLDILENQLPVVNQEKKMSKKVTPRNTIPIPNSGIIGSDLITDNDESHVENHEIDLTRRLKSKDYNIVRIHLHSDPGKKKRKKRPTSDTKKENVVTDIVTNMTNISSSVSDDDSKKTRTHNKISSFHMPKRRKKPKRAFTNALVDIKNGASQNTHQQKVVDVPKDFEHTAHFDFPSHISDGSIIYSGLSDPNFLYPVDHEELILNSFQIETAWLVEENMYCNRITNVDWTFVMNYASPALRDKLRKIPYVGENDDDETLAKLLHNRIEAKRFLIVRREVRRKLLKSVVRKRMQDIVPRLRKATHPLRLQKMQLKRMAASFEADAAAAASSKFFL